MQLAAPWQVLKLRHDENARRYDIWVGVEAPRQWFGFVRRGPEVPVEHYSWRHVNFGDWRVHLHVALPVGSTLEGLPWAGEFDMPFSNQLARQIFALLKADVSLQRICDLLDLPVSELWRFRYALDTGRLNVGEIAPEAIKVDEATDSDIPSLDDPVWAALVDGKLEIDIRVLGLKLMLSRLRAQMEKITDAEIRDLKLQEFQRYFAKNKQMLSHELAQLREGAASV
ncbi:hypothetical protein [Nitrogeniibacter mangrovi]|uniref:hypothetical protein n=1 Tax=Nitrogeniibacter mangrovi TaxID=2016596 RepID=UPI001E4230FB|nr:hypothetical protein [Nitrogeniibacter mangrovi]